MGWHLSKSDPRKVYNERHETVCVCQNSEQSKLIVEAVNRYRQPDMIGYPSRKESAETGQSAGASEHAKAEAPAVQKPDLTALRDAAQGDDTKDASFAVSRRR